MNKFLGNNLKPTIILFINLIGACLLLFSCSSPQIEVHKLTGFVEINPGEEAKLHWSFRNADRVEIVGMPETFAPEDSVTVKPKTTTKYDIVAFRGFDDSLVQTIRVNVLSGEQKEIQRGPETLKSNAIAESSEESEFFKGARNYDYSSGPAQIKIMGYKYPRNNEQSSRVRVMALDEFGNHLRGLTNTKDVAKWDCDNICEAMKTNFPITKIIESDPAKEQKNVDIALLSDFSSIAHYDPNFPAYIKDYISYLSHDDNLMFANFNQTYNLLFPLSLADKALWEFNNLNLPEPKGLSALYKSAFKAIEQLSTGINSSKALIILTFSADNSSIIYNSFDVITAANKFNIPVYVVAVGNAMSTYFLRNMCWMTGGRFYHITNDEQKKLPDILKEITFSQKMYYEFELPLPMDSKDCKKVKTTLNLYFKNKKITDEITFFFKPPLQYSQRQILALFNYKDNNIIPEYNNILTSLAELMKDNPTTKIELIGHSGNEYTPEFNLEISQDRADAVKARLIEQGIPEKQITTKAEGSNMPQYFFERAAWQGFYNRRVEIRWLDPAVLPYEIVVDKSWSEEEATAKAEEWEKRGFRAYYDRYLQNNAEIYKVKLWGYSTQETAEVVAKELSKKYKQNFIVE